MKKFIKIASKSEISSGKMKEYKIGDKTIVIVNIGGKYLAFDGLCTHMQCPLAGGNLDGNILTCYCHGAQFDISDGKAIAPPVRKPLEVYKVKVVGENILVEI